MRETYGTNPSRKCRNCCNLHCKSKAATEKVCIAYSPDLEWDVGTAACGLYNVAFAGLRPVRLPLAESLSVGSENNRVEGKVA